jgi:hypothetical protein
LEILVKKADTMPDKFYLRFGKFCGHHPRYDHYLNSEWKIATISLKDCGAWPRVGDLSDRATGGTIVDTATYMQKILEGKKKKTKEYKKALYLVAMQEYASVITEYVPIIVLEDHVIRHETFLRRKDNTVSYKKTKYDIDDGNHRAIALAMQGHKEIKAFVGKRIYKNPLLYKY